MNWLRGFSYDEGENTAEGVSCATSLSRLVDGVGLLFSSIGAPSRALLGWASNEGRWIVGSLSAMFCNKPMLRPSPSPIKGRGSAILLDGGKECVLLEEETYNRAWRRA